MLDRIKAFLMGPSEAPTHNFGELPVAVVALLIRAATSAAHQLDLRHVRHPTRTSPRRSARQSVASLRKPSIFRLWMSTA